MLRFRKAKSKRNQRISQSVRLPANNWDKREKAGRGQGKKNTSKHNEFQIIEHSFLYIP